MTTITHTEVSPVTPDSRSFLLERVQPALSWLPAATLELKEDDLSDIAAAIRATGAGTGPVSLSAITR